MFEVLTLAVQRVLGFFEDVPSTVMSVVDGSY